MNTFTIAEAAELTGLTKKALRHRVDRGQIRAEKEGNVRRIPRSELERVGLAAALPPPALSLVAPAGTAEQLEVELAATRRELAQSERALTRERALRVEAELRLTDAVAAAEYERELSRRLAEAGPRERRRLTKEVEESERAAQVFFRRVVVEEGRD